MNPIITCKLQNLYGSADRHKEPSGIQAMFISGSRANQIRSIPNPLCWQIAEEVGAKRRLHKWNVCKAMSLLCWNIPRPRNPPWLLKHGRISIIEFSNSSQHPPWWFVRPLVSLFPKGSHPWTSSAFVAQFTDPRKSISVVLTSNIFGIIWPCVCSSWTSLLEALPIRLAGLSSPESQITNTTSSHLPVQKTEFVGTVHVGHWRHWRHCEASTRTRQYNTLGGSLDTSWHYWYPNLF